MRIESRQQSNFYSNTEVWIVWSEAVGDRFRICITAPELPRSPAARVGAVYALDGDLIAGTVAGATRQMRPSGEVPALFAVSIGYPLDHPIPSIAQRNRDLTPTRMPEFDPIIPAAFGVPIVASGGARGFRTFLLDELRPALEAEFPLDPKQALLAGVALGGLFVLDTLLEKPESFRRWLAISPAVWWDQHRAIARAGTVSFPSELDVDIHLCAGEFETYAHGQETHRKLPKEAVDRMPAFMREVDKVDDMRRMAAALRRALPGGARISEAVMPHESFTSLPGVALSQGLRRLYGTLNTG